MGKAAPRDVGRGAAEDSTQFEIAEIEELPNEAEQRVVLVEVKLKETALGIGNRHYELLSVTGGHVGPVTGVVHMPLSGGVQALYGRNGAGKTQLLRIVESAVSDAAFSHQPQEVVDILHYLPRQSFAHLHLRLVDVADRHYNSSPLLAAIAKGAKRAAQAVLGKKAEETRKEADPHDSYAHKSPETLLDLIENLLAQTFNSEADNDVYYRLTEFTHQGRLSLVATGTTGAPRWRVWLAYHPRPEELRRVRIGVDSPDELPELDLEDEDWYRPNAAEPILGRPPRRHGSGAYDGGVRAVVDYVGNTFNWNNDASLPEWSQIPVYDLGFEIEVPAADLVGGTEDRHWTGAGPRWNRRFTLHELRRAIRNSD